MKPTLLICDDDASIRDSLSERFSALGYRVVTAADGEQARERARKAPDLVLLDLQMPRGDGLSVLRGLAEDGIETTVVVLTAYGTVDAAVEAMRLGAYDFLEKPFEPARLEEVVRRGLERSGLVRQNRGLRAERREGELLHRDPAMEEVVGMARKAAKSDATCLILGETGTGKEVLARSLHAWSDRADGPFIAINCAALAESLLESELFGHEKGAFTGAHASRPGKIEAAHGGTLFLDEIGDVSAAFQTRLLRVLQERCCERVGGTHPVEVDVRVVAATNADLKQAVEDGRFREDLYYRLNVIALPLPPLRKRPQDVAALAETFVRELAPGKPPELSPEVQDALARWRWPGNVRELRNVIERAVVLSEGDTIELGDLPEELRCPDAPELGDGFHARVEAHRRELLAEALKRAGGNQTQAAKELGLQRTYLARLIKKYGLS